MGQGGNKNLVSKLKTLFGSIFGSIFGSKRSKIADSLFKVFTFIVASFSIITIFLIFIFIAKEAIPVFTDSEVFKEASLSKLFLPQVFEGYDDARHIWQPNSDYPKFSILPLLISSIKVTLIAMLFGVPIAVLAAIYTSQFANRKVNEIIKPMIELLAGIPSVVLGFFALMVMATWMQDLFGLTFRLNGFTAGIALSFAVIPIIYTISEDALNSVPKSYKEASLALGANYNQTSYKIVFPAALPGIFAAVVLGFGRAIGETMIVLMVSGNAPILTWDIGASLRTISASIAAEMGEVVFGDTHYTVLFFLGFLLFSLTFIINYIGAIIVNGFEKRLRGAGGVKGRGGGKSVI